MEITSIESLKQVKSTEVVELPKFADGTPLVAELKKPSVINMFINGRVTNQLLEAVTQVTEGENNGNDPEAPKKLPDMAASMNFIESLCEECMVNPTYAQVKEYAGGLTDEQMMFIYQYSQKGIETLQSFR